MSKPEVFVNRFSSNQMKVCKDCPNRNIFICKPAHLEKYLKRIPTFADTIEEGVDMIRTPKYCPNTYKNLSSMKIR